MADDDKDDLLGDIRAAMQENAGGDDGAQAQGLGEDEAGTALPAGGERDTGTDQARARDEAGRFAKAQEGKARETLTLKEPKAAAAADIPAAQAPAAGQEKPLDGKQPADPIAPPTEWKGAGKVKWDRLPREIQSELRDVYQAAAADRAEVAPFRELIDTNKQFLINQTGSLQGGMTQLFEFARMSVDNPVGLIQHIAAQRGIDLRAAFSGQPSPGTQQSQPGQTADIAQLVQQQLEPILGQFRQQSLNQEISKIQAFRDDPKHPYFNDVAPRIEGLLKAGAAKDLQDAYDQAIWADPAIRQQLLGAQAEEAKRTHAAEVAKANQARAASLRGSPLPGAAVNGTGNQNSSVHDDVRAAFYAEQ